MKAQFDFEITLMGHEKENFIILRRQGDIPFLPPKNFCILFYDVEMPVIGTLWVENESKLAIDVEGYLFDTWEACQYEAQKWVDDTSEGHWYILESYPPIAEAKKE